MTVQIPPGSFQSSAGFNFGGASMSRHDGHRSNTGKSQPGSIFRSSPIYRRYCIPEVCLDCTILPTSVHLQVGVVQACHWALEHQVAHCTPRVCTPAINGTRGRGSKFNVRYHSKDGFSAGKNGGRLAKMYTENLAREPWENPFVAIIEVPEENAYAIFNDNWDILHENVTQVGQSQYSETGACC